MTVRGIVTVQFVRLRALGMALAYARRRAPEKNPGTRRRTAARTVQDRAGLKIRAVGLNICLTGE